MAWNHDTDGNSVTLTQGGAPGYAPSGVTSGYPAKIPLPASEFVSPRPPTVNIDAAKSPSQRSRALSKGSRVEAEGGEPMVCGILYLYGNALCNRLFMASHPKFHPVVKAGRHQTDLN